MNVLFLKYNSYIFFVLLTICLISCSKKDKLSADFTFDGPNPPIENGTAPEQQLMYKLFQQYDLFYYANRSGDNALRTPLGILNTNNVNAEALPFVEGDKARAQTVLNLLDKLYALFPKEVIKQYSNKVVILVKGNPDNNNYNYVNWGCFNNFFIDSEKGVVAYLGEIDDEIPFDPANTKDILCRWLFTSFHSYYKLGGIPDFREVSKGKYYSDGYDYGYDVYFDLLFDEERAKEDGFVHPIGWYTYGRDEATYISWILNKPLAERQADLNQYPLIERKYTLVIDYYKSKFNIDLEAIAPNWQAVL